MPMNRSGRSVDDASRVIEIEDVFVARIASYLSTRHRSEKNLALDLFLSVAVQLITRSQPKARRTSLAGLMRDTAPLRSSSLIHFFHLARHVAVDGFAIGQCGR